MTEFYSNAGGLSPATDPLSMVFVVFIVVVIFLVMVISAWYTLRRKQR